MGLTLLTIIIIVGKKKRKRSQSGVTTCERDRVLGIK